MAGIGVKQSLNHSLVKLRAALKAAYKLALVAVALILSISFSIVVLAMQSATAKVGVVLLVVFFVAVVIYASTNSYGEAALALAAGLLSVYSVDWTTANFISFVGVWVGFSVLALLISSVRIAAQSESIYREASLTLAPDAAGSGAVESELRRIGADRSIRYLGPIECADAIRIFCFRRVPLDVMASALQAVEMLSVVTQANPTRVARFIADVYRVFDSVSPEDVGQIVDILFRTIRDSAVPPDDFLAGFESSRHLVLSRTLAPQDYLRQLREALEHGIPPEKISDHLTESS